MAIRIHIDTLICKGCGLCILYCPREVLRLSEQRNVKGYPVVEAYNPEECVGCRLCEIGCPDLALYIEDADERG